MPHKSMSQSHLPLRGKDFDSTYRFNENRNYLNLNETQLNKIIEESIRNAIRKY